MKDLIRFIAENIEKGYEVIVFFDYDKKTDVYKMAVRFSQSMRITTLAEAYFALPNKPVIEQVDYHYTRIEITLK